MTKIKGTTQDVTTCENCGRDHLRKTVVIAFCDADGNEEGIGYYGVVCASKVSKQSTENVLKGIKAAEQASHQAWMAQSHARFDAWTEFLSAMSRKTTLADQIRDLGGFAQARALFRAQA